MSTYLSVGKAILLLICTGFIFSSCSAGEPKVLVFSKTAGYYHTSIPDGIEAIQTLGMENGFAVDTTTDAGMFTEENLQSYAAVIFLNTTGDVLDQYQETELERFMQAGGGFVGIHSAADTEYNWGWYGRLVGGYFLDHPGINDPHPNVQEGVVEVADANHAATDFLPEQWNRTDEWYSYKDLFDETNVLLTVDEESYEGGAQMGYHPISWYHEYDGGRAFYTGLGHTSESYEEELYLQHILNGIEYAIGDNSLDYSEAKTASAPRENRFTKTQLSMGEFFEPTEMAILPNLDVLVAQRKGEIYLYKNDQDTLLTAGFIDVYHYSDVDGVNAEEGVVGMAADPDFENNNFVYIYYAAPDTALNRLSRFKFENDKLDMDSETTVLELYSQRDICCHTGGSIAFDSDGLLYLSTGDNSTPFNQRNQEYQLDGYAPLDARPGFEQYDARRTSGNSNDLRGKIIRIEVNEDGTYNIPDGNLYAEGTERTQPEIYVQGTRNPYRISVDPKTDALYWGEIGPDARADSIGVRGSLGYDEINVARSAGHYGWPFFVGNNFPYNEYDYATGTPGIQFDPENPVNNSPNNTGLRELPPAKPALIWYPYTASEEFPLVGSGGRNSMAGPVYYSDLYSDDSALPSYYDGKLFIYDWMRDWIRVVTLTENGEFSKMETFMDQTDFNSVMDMELGPDGHLYVLEYGKGWYSKNPDAALSRIDFNPGNRKPIVHSVSADRTSGLLPLDVTFTANAEDLENNRMTYRWQINSGEFIETGEPTLNYSFEEIGDYLVSVEAVDEAGLASVSESVAIYAGNTAPVVDISIKGNRTFYFAGTNVEYAVNVQDEGPDGSTSTINQDNLIVSADYVEVSEDSDESTSPEGHLIMTDVMMGKNLVSSLGCVSCHNVNDTSVGPSYIAIAERYEEHENPQSYLTSRIINGSVGVWGEVAMPAHSDLPPEDASKIVSWIESLLEDANSNESLPAEGAINPTMGDEMSENGLFVISATYSDSGTAEIKPLSGSTRVTLRNSRVRMSTARNLQNVTLQEFQGNSFLMVPNEMGSFSLNGIDLSDVNSIEVTVGAREALEYPYNFEVRLGSPEGTVIGEAQVKPDTRSAQGFFEGVADISIEPVTDNEFHDIYFISTPTDNREEGTMVVSGVEFKAN